MKAATLAIVAGLVFSGALKAAAHIKTSDERFKKVLTCAKDVFFGLVGFGHPIAAIPIGTLSPLLGFGMDQLIPVRDHTHLVKELQGDLELSILGAQDFPPEGRAFWTERNQDKFFKYLPTVLHCNGL